MSAPPPVQPPHPSPQPYQVGSVVTNPRPSDFGFPIRKDEFEILCEGEISEARAGRDLYIGSCVGGVVGLLGVLATTDWTTIWQPERRVAFVVWGAILLIIVAASAAGACIHQQRLTRTLRTSPYSRLRSIISAYFESQAP
jgi:hypothetical protein